MDHLLETATLLLPHVNATRPDARTEHVETTLQGLNAKLAGALADVYKRRARLAGMLVDRRDDPAETKPPEPPELARSAPRVLEIAVLADLLAKTPSVIPQGLAEAGKPDFYPTFLTYLILSVEEIVINRRPGLWKRIAAAEHLDLLSDRQQRVSEILLSTDSWRARAVAPPTAPDASRDKGSSAKGSLSSSMLGSEELGARAAEQCRRAARYVREKVRRTAAEWMSVVELLQSGGPPAESFLRARAPQQRVAPPLVERRT
jgi:hypothetical protein